MLDGLRAQILLLERRTASVDLVRRHRLQVGDALSLEESDPPVEPREVILERALPTLFDRPVPFLRLGPAREPRRERPPARLEGSLFDPAALSPAGLLGQTLSAKTLGLDEAPSRPEPEAVGRPALPDVARHGDVGSSGHGLAPLTAGLLSMLANPPVAVDVAMDDVDGAKRALAAE
jgi:hypothetical protein